MLAALKNTRVAPFDEPSKHDPATKPRKDQQLQTEDGEQHPFELHFSIKDSYSLKIKNGLLPFHLNGYNLLQESLTSKYAEDTPGN